MSGSPVRKLVQRSTPSRVESSVALPLALARITAVDGDSLTLSIGRKRITATRDPALHAAVVSAAFSSGERVLVELSDDGSANVVGALRTQPTPGLEKGERFAIEANEVSIAATRITVDGEEVVLGSKSARLILRAAGEIESFADRIVSRASGVHKIVGRMLRLN